MNERQRVREARKNLSTILANGKTVAVGHRYGQLRGFIVGMPQHENWNTAAKQKALKAAKKAFLEAWTAEYKSP